MLRNGGVVAFPTETVYGLGADVFHPLAIREVFQRKGRPADNPLIVHVASLTQLRKVVAELPQVAKQLIDAFWPGPLTLVLPKHPNVPDIATGGLNSVAVRMPDHPLALELLRLTGPLVAPSANRSGKPSPTKAEHVREDFGEELQVIDGGPTEVGLESTVLDLTSKPYHILRPGQIGSRQISEVIGAPVVESAPSQPESPRSPGQKYTHYKPDAEVQWLENSKSVVKAHELVLLHTRNDLVSEGGILEHTEGDLFLMARQLYDFFRFADHEAIRTVYVEPLSDAQLANSPIARALQNRLTKAVGEF